MRLLLFHNVSAWMGLNHAWEEVNWMGKYPARISASAQELHTLVLGGLKT